MLYRDLGVTCSPDSTIGDGSLNALTGEATACGNVIRGFDGHQVGSMAGTALFDLSDLAGQQISLRFAFASNNTGALAEGINIDNIKVTQCVPGDPDCDPPQGDVPEPSSAALALLGVTALWRRRKQRQA